MGAAVRRSVRGNGHLRRVGRPAAGEKRQPPRIGQGGGGAVAHNPVSVIVPCHRVTGTGGRLTGYAGGLERKRQLLRREQGLPFEPFNGGGSPGSISAP